MRGLSVTLNKDFIQLFLHSHWLVIVYDDMSHLCTDQFEHLFGPKTELSGTSLGFSGMQEHGENIIVHLLSQ